MQTFQSNMDPYVNSGRCSSHNKKSKYICHEKPHFCTEASIDTFPKRDRTRSAYKKSQSVIGNKHLKGLDLLAHPVMKTTTIQMTEEPQFSKSKISNHRLKGKNIVCCKIRHNIVLLKICSSPLSCSG